MLIENDYIIPSNFCRHLSDEINYEVVPLIANRNWITAVRIPFDIKTKDIFETLIKSNSDNDLLFDGCPKVIKNILSDYQFNLLQVGREAILHLDKNHFEKKSVQELIKRGLKKGNVKEFPYSEENQLKLKNFVSISSISNLPKLKHLFCNTFEKFTRLFVFLDKEDNWLGVITISHKSELFIQTELIMRRKNNPIGIMEALIFEIFQILKKEGKEYWSLGAVPFVIKVPFSFSKQWLINFAGRRLRFAYNYEGLFNFKNKFMPTWIDYYICFNNKISFLQLYDLMRKSNLLALVAKKILLKLWIKNE